MSRYDDLKYYVYQWEKREKRAFRYLVPADYESLNTMIREIQATEWSMSANHE